MALNTLHLSIDFLNILCKIYYNENKGEHLILSYLSPQNESKNNLWQWGSIKFIENSEGYF